MMSQWFTSTCDKIQAPRAAILGETLGGPFQA